MSITLDEALTSVDGLEDLDAVETLEQAGEIQRHVNLAQAETLKIACHWADLNAVLDSRVTATIPGTERLVQLGGDGTPQVAEFAAAELGAQLSMSPGGCAIVIADALDLRHRLPLLWPPESRPAPLRRLVVAIAARVLLPRRRHRHAFPRPSLTEP